MLKIISLLNNTAIITTSITMSGICWKVSASSKSNNSTNNSINSSNNDTTDYSNDDEKLTQKVVVLKLKSFFFCNVVRKLN